MKTKQLTISLIFILLMMLAACGDSDSTPETDKDDVQGEASSNQENNEKEEAGMTSEEASQTSEAFLTHLEDGNIDEAEALFDEVMASEITAADLEAIWNDLETEFGEFTGFDYVDDQQVDGYDSFIYEGMFGDQTVILNVSINSNNEVGGFFIRPAEG